MSENPSPRGTEPSVVVGGDNHGIISTGHHAINVIHDERGFVELPSLLDLPLREPPVLSAAPAPAGLFGRDEIVAQVFGQLTGGISVQLYGATGVGKKAIAKAVHRKLAARGQRGHILYPRAGEPGTLDTLYERLAGAFFGKNFLRGVDETMLHAAVAKVAHVHITVIECALDREDLARLLQTFPGCTFLLTSPYPTLPDTAAAHHVQPLARTAAIELLSAELGLPLGPAGLQNLQFDHAYRMAEGKPQRLRQYAEFIKGSDEWRARKTEEPHDQPPPVDPAQLSPQQQAEALAVALSEPARRVLIALATFGTPLPAAWFAPVTGFLQDTYAGLELYDRRLVTYHGDAYHITADAVAAVRRQNWAPTAVATAAEGLLAALAERGGPPGPDPGLLLAVARALRDAQQWGLASYFIRFAVPVALTEGRGQVALQLYVLGRLAATRSGMTADLEYYARSEQLTRNLLEGDKVAAAAALLVLAPPVGKAAVANTGKVAAYLGKLTATVSTKVGITVTAAAVAAATTTGVVVVATDGGGGGMPAGCAEAGQAHKVYLKRTEGVRTHRELVGPYRQMSSDLSAAAAKATDPKVKSALQAQAGDWNSKAGTQQREDDKLGSNVHPDVRASLASARALADGTGSFAALLGVCPDAAK